MSVAFMSQPKGRQAPNPMAIQKLLDENTHLIQAISDYQNKGRASDCLQYQQMLHRNLVYLASIADSNQNIQQLLPPPSPIPNAPNPTPGQPQMPPGQIPNTSNPVLSGQPMDPNQVPPVGVGQMPPPNDYQQQQQQPYPSHPHANAPPTSNMPPAGSNVLPNGMNMGGGPPTGPPGSNGSVPYSGSPSPMPNQSQQPPNNYPRNSALPTKSSQYYGPPQSQQQQSQYVSQNQQPFQQTTMTQGNQMPPQMGPYGQTPASSQPGGGYPPQSNPQQQPPAGTYMPPAASQAQQSGYGPPVQQQPQPPPPQQGYNIQQPQPGGYGVPSGPNQPNYGNSPQQQPQRYASNFSQQPGGYGGSYRPQQGHMGPPPVPPGPIPGQRYVYDQNQPHPGGYPPQ